MVKTWPLERLSDLQLGDKHVILNHLMLLHYLVRKWISACILMIHSPEKWWLGELPILRGYASFREVFFLGGWDMVKGTPNPQVLKGQKGPTLLTKVVADWWSTMSRKVNCSLDVPFDAPQKNLLNMDTGREKRVKSWGGRNPTSHIILVQFAACGCMWYNVTNNWCTRLV